MIEPPLITTVITTFERPKLLRRAIESAQRQTLSSLTIFVYDSASRNETGEMVLGMAKKDPRIKYFRHPNRVTAVQNYQFGIDRVKTPFFSLLSDDDYLLPQFYEKALHFLNKYPSAQFFLGSTIDADTNGKPISALARNWPDREYLLPFEGLPLAIRSYINWTGALYRTNPAQKLPLNPNVVPGDYDFILRLAAQYPFAFSPHPCAVFTHHAGSFSSHCGLKLIYPSLFDIAKSIYPLRPEGERPQIKIAFDLFFLRSALRIGIQNLIHKDLGELELLSQAIRAACPTYFLGKILPPLFDFLRQSSFFRFLFLSAFFFYRRCKSLRVKRYLR